MWVTSPVVCLPGGPMQDSAYLGDLGGMSGRPHSDGRARAVELYESGLSLNEVASRLGISRSAVRAAVVAADIPLRSRYYDS